MPHVGEGAVHLKGGRIPCIDKVVDRGWRIIWYACDSVLDSYEEQEF